MALDSIVTGSAEVVIKNLTRVIAALGGVLFLYLVFNIVNFYINRKRIKVLNRIERKLDLLISLSSKDKKLKK